MLWLMPFRAHLLPPLNLFVLSFLLFQPPPLLLFLLLSWLNSRLCALKLNSSSILPLSNMPNASLVMPYFMEMYLLATSAPSFLFPYVNQFFITFMTWLTLASVPLAASFPLVMFGHISPVMSLPGAAPALPARPPRSTAIRKFLLNTFLFLTSDSPISTLTL